MSREMVDSGIQWFNDIPKEWKILQIKNIFDIGRGRVISQQELKEDGVYPVYSSQTKNNGILGYIDTYDFDKEQITWTTDGANAGTIFLRDGKYNCTNVCGTLSLKKKFKDYNMNYLKYILSHTCFYHKRQDTNGFKIMNNEMARISILIPSLYEQNRIANYLDKKCAKIDEIIKDNNHEIKLLEEYKKSLISEICLNGIKNNIKKQIKSNWIKEIPIDWRYTNIKSEFNFRKGLSITKADLVKSGIKVISYGQIHSKINNGTEINDNLFRFVPNDYLKNNKNSLVEFGDYIFADTSEDIEGCGNNIYVDRLDDEIFAGYHTIIAHKISKNKSKYFGYLFKTNEWRSQIRKSVYGVKLFSITQKILKNSSIIIPPINEQREISNYLDKKCSKLDEVIKYRKQIIEKLEEYKSSLIYEVVTGKKEV